MKLLINWLQGIETVQHRGSPSCASKRRLPRPGPLCRPRLPHRSAVVPAPSLLREPEFACPDLRGQGLGWNPVLRILAIVTVIITFIFDHMFVVVFVISTVYLRDSE